MHAADKTKDTLAFPRAEENSNSCVSRRRGMSPSSSPYIKSSGYAGLSTFGRESVPHCSVIRKDRGEEMSMIFVILLRAIQERLILAMLSRRQRTHCLSTLTSSIPSIGK